MSKVIIIGGGAAGMFAAAAAAENGHTVHIYEKNEKLGKKLFITGKGRCNLTNACDMEELFDAVGFSTLIQPEKRIINPCRPHKCGIFYALLLSTSLNFFVVYVVWCCILFICVL